MNENEVTHLEHQVAQLQADYADKTKAAVMILNTVERARRDLQVSIDRLTRKVTGFKGVNMSSDQHIELVANRTHLVSLKEQMAILTEISNDLALLFGVQV